MVEPWYGDFDGLPSRYDGEGEAWVFRGGGSEGWDEINSASHGNAVRQLSKKDFEYFFPDLPPLPATAFVAFLAGPFYGTVAGRPSCYDGKSEAWVYHEDKGA
jgi:hypothetical protein